MLFDVDITTPANTTKAAPLRTVVPIILGRITQVNVFVPPGSAGLAHLKILWGLYQLFPTNQEGDFSASGNMLTWQEDIAVDHEPAALTMVTWNDDDTYDHTVHVSVAMLTNAPQPSIQDVVTALQAAPPAVAPTGTP